MDTGDDRDAHLDILRLDEETLQEFVDETEVQHQSSGLRIRFDEEVARAYAMLQAEMSENDSAHLRIREPLTYREAVTGEHAGE